MKFARMLGLVSAALSVLTTPFRGLAKIGALPGGKTPGPKNMKPYSGGGSRRAGARRLVQDRMYGSQPCARAFSQHSRRYG